MYTKWSKWLWMIVGFIFAAFSLYYIVAGKEQISMEYLILAMLDWVMAEVVDKKT